MHKFHRRLSFIIWLKKIKETISSYLFLVFYIWYNFSFNILIVTDWQNSQSSKFQLFNLAPDTFILFEQLVIFRKKRHQFVIIKSFDILSDYKHYQDWWSYSITQIPSQAFQSFFLTWNNPESVMLSTSEIL